MKIRIRKWWSILMITTAIFFLGACAGKEEQVSKQKEADVREMSDTPKLTFENMHFEVGEKPAYAECFQIEKCGEYELITIVDSGRFLLVSGGNEVPEELPDDVVVLHTPLDKVYLAASSGFDFARQLGSLDKIPFTGTKEKDLYIKEAVEAIETGQMTYAGKYSAPDYELLLDGGCQVAIESTMIYHSPATKEKLEALGIPVVVERSSYESHPLGRMEWIKFYGALFGKEAEANAFFEEEVSKLSFVMEAEDTGCKVAFFYVNTNGAINVRKPGDYIAKMVELAGGQYVPGQQSEEEENALSSMNMQIEDFYLAAKDADVLIYNGTINGALENKEELIAKNALFADFKAVQENRVYCTGKDVFQETTSIGGLMEDMGFVIHGKDEDLKQMTKLK